MKKKLTIFINNLSNGGAERVVSRLFDDRFFIENVSLLTLDSNDFYGCKSASKTTFQSRYKLFSSFKAILYLLKLDKNNTIQSHLNYPIIISGISKTLGAKFYFQAVHCFSYSSFYKNKNLLYKVIHKFLMARFLSKANLHIFKSKEMVSDFEFFFGWLPENMMVINNPLDKGTIEIQAKESIPNTFNYNNDKLNIAIVGRLNLSKRPYDVLNVAKSLQSEVDFHFFGNGPEMKKMQEFINENNIVNVFLHGMVKNPFKFVRKFGVYLSCSESEGFPNSLVESLACQAIPIHSDCLTGPKEILCSDFNAYISKKYEFSVEYRGLLFPVGDLVALSEAIVFVNENRKYLEEAFFERNMEYLDSLSVGHIVNKYKVALFEGVYEK
ncbi:glycosyltransferase [Vibrio kanaloae]|uniref:Glycosyltransferase n=1 Tax=Vibrio kanaloae TaxID=170673 RepID=A0A4U1Z0N7_9VIBR|nr:glycosyltransferase [Vibrio kanaloae]TKF25921.1 glycosyltransferase [Vibrio kanaloae]